MVNPHAYAKGAQFGQLNAAVMVGRLIFQKNLMETYRKAEIGLYIHMKVVARAEEKVAQKVAEKDFDEIVMMDCVMAACLAGE